MRPSNSLGIGLSLLFGGLFLATVAEVYYLLWRKKKIADRDVEDDYATAPGELLDLFCRRKPSSLQPAAANLHPQGLRSSGRAAEGAGGKELPVKPFGSDDGVEAELMRLHPLAGPPRFLFTIKEETKEELESDDGRSTGDESGKGSRRCSLGNILAAESPPVSPPSSPPLFAPPLMPTNRRGSRHGFENPPFESSEDDGWRRIRSSPPPKFKFLRDAEDKLYRKTLMEEALKVSRNRVSLPGVAVGKAAGARASIAAAALAAKAEEEEGSFITVIISKSKEQSQQMQQHSTSSQVIPLPPPSPSLRKLDGETKKIQFP